MAITKLTHVTIIVRDQEEALAWYIDKFGFEKRVDDSQTAPGYRWLTMAPKGQTAPEIALFQARNEQEQSWVGQGTLWVMETHDCRATCRDLAAKGVKVLNEPQDLPWGVSAIIEDLYGNPYNLLQPRR